MSTAHAALTFATPPAKADGAVSGARPAMGRDPMLGQTLGQKLRLEAILGAGALGVVYRAKHVHLLSALAVKVLHERFRAGTSFRARFHAEARAASMLDHPNLVRLLDFGEEDDGTLWLAMELLEGETLEQHIATKRRLSLARAVAIVSELGAGLAHAHALGIVHGDVKPANVVLVQRHDDDGQLVERAKLCDFGVARSAAARADLEGFDDGASLGTPLYMSPEQCLGESIDARSDVYSLGVVLYELLTGAPPFRNDDPMQLLRQHVLLEPIRPSIACPDIDPKVDAIVMRALAKDRHERYASMRELRAALKGLVSTSDTGPRPSSPPSFIPPRHLTPRASDIRPLPSIAGAAASADANEAAADVRDFLAARSALKERETRALSALLEGGEIDAAASRVARLLRRDEPGADSETADEALALVREPKNLGPIAERLLAEDVPASPYLEQLLEAAGTSAARALWSARVRNLATEERRTRFVAWLRVLGPGARDVLLAALARLEPNPKVPDNAENAIKRATLAEDILLALPPRLDHRLSNAVARLATSAAPRVRELALAALARDIR